MTNGQDDDGDLFAMLTVRADGKGGHVDVVGVDGVERVATLETHPPCECPCRALLLNGVLFGPGKYSEVHEAMLQLDRDASFAMGDESYLREHNPGAESRPLEDLAEHFAQPGRRIGDDA